jgi:PAS domain S-box-containing protein
MIPEVLHDRAALYVAGAMTAAERENFELVLEFHPGLRSEVARLQDAGTALWLAVERPQRKAPPSLKDRILAALGPQPRPEDAAGFVAADARGRVEWVNPAFTALCGYSLDEIKGRKPGEFLQGPATDRHAVQRIRAALQTRQPCRETLANYHKDGTRYHVDIAITPIVDDDGEPLWFVARERKVSVA